MRPALTCIGLAVVALLATTTVAAAATYSGRGTDDARMRVSFEREQGKVKRFTIEQARFFCADGDRFRDGTRVGVMKIRRTREGVKKFKGHFSNADGSQTGRVSGAFVSDRRARGSFRLIAEFEQGGCETRNVTWRAQKQPPT